MVAIIVCLLFFVLCSLLFKRDNIIFKISIAFMFCLFAFSFENADYINYEREYINSSVMNWKDSEPIWILLMHICNKIGFSFQLFRGVVFLIGITLINNSIKKITIERNIFLLLYFIYPFIIDATQIRNFLAMSILIFALQYLTIDNKKGIVKYIGLIIVATLVHNIFIGYLLLVLVNLFDFKKALGIVAVVFAGMAIFFKLLPSIVMKFFDNYHNGLAHAEKYVMKSTVSFTMIIALFVFYFIVIIGAVWAYKKCILFMGTWNNTEAEKNTIIVYLKCIVLISLSFFLNVYSMDFARIFRNVVVIEYAIIISLIRKAEKKQRRLPIAILAFSVIYACWLFIYYPYSENVFAPFFTSNSFFEWIVYIPGQ